MTTSFERRFAQKATADPGGFGSAVVQRYGHTPANVGKLLDLAVKLSAPSGGKISDADVKMLRELHPQTDARFIAEVASEINAQAPALRGQYFIAMLTQDRSVGEHDNLVDASDAYREVQALVKEHETQTYADELIRRHGGNEDATPAWKPEPGSVRDHIERAMTPRVHREFVDRFEAGDPVAEDVGRHLLANTIDHSANKLEDNSLGLRDHLSAAYDMHASEAMAESEYGLDGSAT